MDDYARRRRALEGVLESLPDLAVAFSGGVDSSVLLFAAQRALGERAVGLIGDSPALPRRELAEALEFGARIGAHVEVLATHELAVEGYRENDGRRCYFCRHTLFTAMADWVLEHGFSTLAYGEITDDRLEVRPGRRAAAELAVRSPLAEAGFSKEDVRRYAREHGLAVAEKAQAACLASRLPLGTPVTEAALRRIELAEEALRPHGFELLRVRDHGLRARVEVMPKELARARRLGGELAAALAPLGFAELELAPYRRPSAGEQDTTLPAAKSVSR